MKLMPAERWNHILIACGVKPITAAKWSIVFEDVVSDRTFSKGNADLQAFLGQILHESEMLEQLSERMSYSAPRLMVVWPTRFPTIESTVGYVGNPEALANKVYGGRYGNTEPGDGWLYRARGPLGLTFKDNYEFVGDLMGQDLVGLPGLMEQPRYALEGCILWWEDKVPDSMLGDIEKQTRIVNGGSNGLADRKRLVGLAGMSL